jgi:two-component system NtrC family sensor kinase
MTAVDGRTHAPAAVAGAISRSVGAKLFTVVLFVLLLTLSLLGYVNVRLHRQQLDAHTLRAAERMGNVIRRSVGDYMMRHDREALRQIIAAVGQEPDITRVRLFNRAGRVAFSSVPGEEGKLVTVQDAQCRGCHSGGAVLVSSELKTPFHTYDVGGHRELGVITPIYNSASCSSAECHAHPASQRVLGVLESNLSLAASDAGLALATKQFVAYSAIAVMLMLLSTALFVWRFVHVPVTALRHGTERLIRGDLGYQLAVTSRDELGGLARSFNSMSRQLADAREEVTTFTRTLEQRVGEKTAELHRATDQMIQAEKLTSLGKLAAVVAHEINNPLSGILTYARLLRKWIERGDSLETRSTEMRESLQLIESESRRCGDIVHNLLAFARVPPMNIEAVDVNQLVRRCIKLVEHKLELGGIEQTLDLDPQLPGIRGDAGQIEQLLLALIMNAIEAMPQEGNLRVVTSRSDDDTIVIRVEDDGTGINEAILPRLFDPFVTTKEDKGVGLGLAVSRSIVERHQGTISVKSQVGVGTTFTIQLPVGAVAPQPEEAVAVATGS